MVMVEAASPPGCLQPLLEGRGVEVVRATPLSAEDGAGRTTTRGTLVLSPSATQNVLA